MSQNQDSELKPGDRKLPEIEEKKEEPKKLGFGLSSKEEK